MPVYYALVLSVFVHLVLFWLSPDEAIRPEVSKTSIEVQYVDQPKPVVREVVPPKNLIENESPEEDEPAVLWSENKVRVKKQQKARATGLTQNRVPEPASSERQKPKLDDGPGALAPDPVEIVKEHTRVSPEPSQPTELRAPTGISTRGESLSDDIQIGQFTALNVDPYLYYSFFTRIEEFIRYRWENHIINATHSAAGLSFLPKQDRWITYLEVELTEDGQYVNSRVIKRSGLSGFDLAAVRAFREARQFPNPPEDLIENGRVILQYAFEIHWDPQRLVRRR